MPASWNKADSFKEIFMRYIFRPDINNETAFIYLPILPPEYRKVRKES